MKARIGMVILLLGCAASAPTSARAQGQAGGDSPAASATAEDEHGAYLSLGFGNGRMHGENENGTRWMRGRAFEARAGRDQENVFGNGRIDFVHYNEGHPENNHRDGFALQWVAVRPLGASFTGELGIGPYLSMNTTTGSDGREIDDARWGLLLSAALRVPLDAFPDGTHLRLGLNHALMSSAYSSTAVTLGLGRQFGPARPEPDTEPISGPWWFGASVGWSVTNMSGTESAHAGVLEARKYLGPRMEHWAVSGKLVIEGDDGTRVDRRGIAGQLWYVQQVTPRFSMSAGIGPYLARNRREDDDTRANLLISFQAERALSRQTRAFINFNRVKTFRETNERDLFQVGILKRF